MKKRTAVIAMLMAAVVAPSAQATSQDECSIWLCLPGGFPAGCSAAYSAMVNRIKHLKPPLPDFLSCVIEEPAEKMSYTMGTAAYVPEQKECSYAVIGGRFTQTCTTVPAHYLEGQTCMIWGEGSTGQGGCTGTVQSIKVFSNSQQMGDTYHWSYFGMFR